MRLTSRWAPWTFGLALIIIFYFCFVQAVFAQVNAPGAGDIAPAPDGPNAFSFNLWLVIIGVGVRALMYVINHSAPFLKTEPQKQVATVVVAAVAGALYQALSDGNLGLNDATLNVVVQAVVATLLAHNWLFKPGNINFLLGGGTNSDGTVSDPKLAHRKGITIQNNTTTR